MGLWNLGSVADTVYALVEDIPNNWKGKILTDIADRSRQSVADYAGTTIGSNSIDIKYQEAILQLSIAKTTNNMMSLGADASKVKLGDFEVSKGSTSNLDTIYKNSLDNYNKELKTIGRKSTSYKANG